MERMLINAQDQRALKGDAFRGFTCREVSVDSLHRGCPHLIHFRHERSGDSGMVIPGDSLPEWFTAVFAGQDAGKGGLKVLPHCRHL